MASIPSDLPIFVIGTTWPAQLGQLAIITVGSTKATIAQTRASSLRSRGLFGQPSDSLGKQPYLGKAAQRANSHRNIAEFSMNQKSFSRLHKSRLSVASAQ
jgi:hypothetical protein